MKTLIKQCHPGNIIPAVRETLAVAAQCRCSPSTWRVGMGFWAAFENCATVVKIEKVEQTPEAIEEALKVLPQPTMGGVPVLFDPNMERNKAALVGKDGSVVIIINLGEVTCHSSDNQAT